MEEQTPRLYPHDILMKHTVLRLIPGWLSPNHFTILRFLMIPAVLWFLFVENYKIGIPLFFLAAFTDAIDGSLARTRNQITYWGIVYDPVADKILISSALFVLILKHINIYLGTAIILFEIVCLFFAWLIKRKRVLKPANIFGKVKTVLQVSAVMALLIALQFGFDYESWLLVSQGALGLSLGFGVVSVIKHLV